MKAISLAATALLSLGAAAGVLAQDPSGTTNLLTIAGESTLRSWSCSTTSVRGSVATAPGEGVSIAGLPAGTHEAEITIPISSIDCRNGTMNGHLRRALRAGRQPEIRFEIDRYVADGTDRVRAEGNLSVAGRITPIQLEASLVPAPEGVRVSGSVELRMTRLGVDPPSLMLGTLKVHDPIRIEFDVYLAQREWVATR